MRWNKVTEDKVYSIYIIKRESKKGVISFYTGYTTNPGRRWKTHHRRGCNKPFKLHGMSVIEKFTDHSQAVRRETAVKKWTYYQKRTAHDIIKILNGEYYESLDGGIKHVK